MANAVWLSALVAGHKVNSTAPQLVMLIRQLPDPQPRAAYSTTSGTDVRPRAFGFLVDATAKQITDLNADSLTWCRKLPSNWRTLAWSDVPSAQRNRLVSRLGIDPGIELTDLLPVAFDKVLAAMGDDASMKTIAAIEEHLGVAL